MSEDAIWLILKMAEEAMSQGMQETPRSWKNKETNDSLALLEGKLPC